MHLFLQTVVSISAVLFKKTAIVIVILGQKTLYWQLSKVIPSGKRMRKK